MEPATERPLWNPYLAGVALGLVLLAAFLFLGFGLGASGASNRVAVMIAHWVAPVAVEHNAYMGPYVKQAAGGHLLYDWVVFMTLGVFVGGAFGAYSGGRLRGRILRGPRISARSRLLIAFAGGVVLGVGARIDRGCTSGQGLTGGALLAVAGWTLMGAFFAGAYLLAPLLRRQWR